MKAKKLSAVVVWKTVPIVEVNSQKNKERKREMDVLSEIRENLIMGQADMVKELVKTALDEGMKVEEVLNEGLISAMNIVGERFRREEIYVPEVLFSARAMRAGLEILEPLLIDARVEPKGKAIVGTIKGDIHDIGKNLVITMLKGAGISIVDLGVDVSPQKFVEAAQAEGAELICMSSLITTSMTYMKTTMLEEIFPSDLIWMPGDPYLPEAIAAKRKAKGAGPLPRLFEQKSALATMPVPDPRKSKIFTAYLEMCRKVNSLFDDHWIFGTAPGVWSSIVEFRGAEQLIYDTREDPDFVHGLMRFGTELAKVRGVAVAETGVNVHFGDPSASCSLISPKIYREFVKPYHQEVFQYVKEKVGGQAKVGLHMCGYIDPIIEDIASLPIDWLEMDSPSSLHKAVEVTQKRIVIRGNVAGPVLSRGIKQEIEEAVKSCLDIAAEGSAYILAPGCSMPQNASLEAIKYFWEAVQKYGQYDHINMAA